MAVLTLTAQFASLEEYAAAFAGEIAHGGLLVRGATVKDAPAMSECRVRVEVAGVGQVEVGARIAAAVAGVGVAVLFSPTPPELAALAQGKGAAPAAPEPAGEAVPAGGEEEEEGPPGPMAERLRALNASQKMALALSASREERFHLLRDPNKLLHVYVLRNPRIGLDEVQWAARMSTLSPEALKMISEHREWGSNSTVCTALVRNPRTPLPIAVRLLEKIPASEVRAIAKGGARDQVVQAARRKING